MEFLHNSHIPINLCTCGFVWIRGCSATQSEFSNTSIIHFGCFFLFTVSHFTTAGEDLYLRLQTEEGDFVLHANHATFGWRTHYNKCNLPLWSSFTIFFFNCYFFFKVGVIFLPRTVCGCLLTANDSWPLICEEGKEAAAFLLFLSF